MRGTQRAQVTFSIDDGWIKVSFEQRSLLRYSSAQQTQKRRDFCQRETIFAALRVKYIYIFKI